MSVCVFLSLSLSFNNAPKFIGRDVLRERERERSLSKSTVVQGMSAKHPHPSYPSAGVIIQTKYFKQAGFLAKSITSEGTSHYYRCVWGGGAWYGVTFSAFSFEVHQFCYAPSTHLPPVARTFSKFVYRLLLVIPEHCLSVLTLMFRSC